MTTTSQRPKFYITTAISYTNGLPHMGHAYEVLATDAIARFKALDGYDVFFLTGTDEHGQKVQRTAEKAGQSPAEFVDRMAPLFIGMAEKLNCSHNDFIRTSQTRHHHASQALWKRMADNGDIYLGSYSGWYSVRDEAFYAEDETEIRDGQRYSVKTDTEVEWVDEPSYFFRLSEYRNKLLDLYEQCPEFIGPKERRNEVASFVRKGLDDLSISRTTFNWGVKVPDAPGHVMYVWVDALTNYLTAIGFPDDDAARARYWPADIHVIGKDILRFHAIYWPAFLMSAGVALPKRVFGHGFVFHDGSKMSKSLGNVVSIDTLIDNFGLDQVRYFFLREIPFGQDGNYSHQTIINRINADLANDLGNLAQRCLSMIAKHCNGLVPQCGALSDADHAILNEAEGLIDVLRRHHENQALHRALEAIWYVIAEANKYFSVQEPWALRKTDPERMATVLYVTIEALRHIGIVIQPYMPDSGSKLLDVLAVAPDKRDFLALGEGARLTPGALLPRPKPLFPRYEAPSDAGDGLAN